MPLALKFVVAFVIVLVLIGLAAWLVRRFGSARLEGGSRGRQPRLAVLDATNIDGRRKLILVRRDNVEHLLMIGGGSDVVVETNIVRAPPQVSPVRDLDPPVRTPMREQTVREQPVREAPSRDIPLRDYESPPLRPVDPVVRRPAIEEPPLRPAAPLTQPNLAQLEADIFAPAPSPAARAEPAPVRIERTQDVDLGAMAAKLEDALRRPAAAPPPPRIERPTPPPRMERPIERPAERLNVPPPQPRPMTTPVAPPVQSARPAPVTSEPVAPTKPDSVASDIDARLAELKMPELRLPELRPTAPKPAVAAPAPSTPPVAMPPAKAETQPPGNVFDSLEAEMANLLGRPKDPA